MIATPEQVISEVAHETIATRRYLADQIRNGYAFDDPLANVLEERAGQRLLAVRFQRDDQRVSAEVLEEGLLENLMSEFCSDEKREVLKQDSRKFNPGDEWPAGMRSIHKKIKHAEAMNNKGFEVSTVYGGYRNLRFAHSNIAQVQLVAEDIIDRIMSDPVTFIDRGRSIDIFNSQGFGFRCLKNPYTFSGFIDPQVYVKPISKNKKQELRMRKGVAV